MLRMEWIGMVKESSVDQRLGFMLCFQNFLLSNICCLLTTSHQILNIGLRLSADK